MNRFKHLIKSAVAIALTYVLCASALLQPMAVYAATLQTQQSTAEAADASSTQDSSAGDVSDGTTDGVSKDADSADAAQDEATPADAADEDQTANEEDAAAPESLDAEDEQAADDTVIGDNEANSWRYQNGELRSDLQDDNAIDLGIESRSMHEMPEGATLQGIDVSGYQKDIDWQKVKDAGIDFAILKIGNINAREPDGWYTDSYFQRNVTECERLGIPYGVYAYSYAKNADDAVKGANHIIALLEGHKPTLPVYLDLEDNSIKDTDHASIAKAFCNTISAAGYTPGIYASASWFKNILTDPCFTNSGWGIWTAQYWYGQRYDASWGLGPEYPAKFDCWQYSSLSTVPGIDGNCDINYWYKDRFSVANGNSHITCDKLAAEHASDLPDGTYRLSPVLSASVAAEVAGASAADGAPARIWDANGTDAQLWRVSHDAAGYVVLENAASGKVLDLPGASAVPAAALQQYASNGTRAQRWIAVKGEDGSFELLSAVDPSFAVELPGASTSAGTRLSLYSRNGTAAQRWAASAGGTALERAAALAAEHVGDLPDGTYALCAGGSRSVLEVAGASSADGAQVRLWGSNATAAQRWRVSHDAGGFVTITNVASGKVLDVRGAVAFAGTAAWQYGANGSLAQKWVAVALDDGSFRFVSALSADLVLDARGGVSPGAAAQLWSANGTAAQSWLAVSASPEVAPCADEIPDGWYRLSASCSTSGRVVDVAGASRSNGARVQLYSANGTAAQLFSFTYEDGYYRIVSARSGKSLDVAGGDVVPGAAVQQWDPGEGNGNQLWSASRNGDGAWTFVNKATGLALDVGSAADADGAALDARVPDGSPAQRFTLLAQEDLLEEGVYTIPLTSTGATLDVQWASTNSGAPVQLYSANGTFAQKWYVSKVAGLTNTYTMECVNSGLLLTMSNACSIVQSPSSGKSNQFWKPEFVNGSVRWTNVGSGEYLTASYAGSGASLGVSAMVNDGVQLFDPVRAAASLEDGTYFICSSTSTGAVLDVSGGSVSNGANVQIWGNNDSGAQKWTFGRQADGTYTIMNARSHKMLDLTNGRAASGTNVQQWSGWDTRAQRWFVDYRSGGWKISSAVDPSYVLDINGGNTSNGSNAQIWKSNDSGAQRFHLAKTSYVQEYIGYQNPAQYYQVSHNSVNIPHLGQGIFGYRTPSKISYNATRNDCVNAMITTAISYVGTTPYVWDYSCAPGVGVDCAGLVMQSLYATGMNLGRYNPWDHYYTPGHDHYANDMWNDPRFLHLAFSQRQRGDLICYNGHIAIYIGNDQIIEASSPKNGVRVHSVYVGYNIKGVLRPFV